MSAFYELQSAGADPVSLADMKLHLKATSSTTDDALITALILAATEHGEMYSGREFKANTWKLFLDTFSNPMVLKRSPVDTITSVKYLVSDVLTTVASSVYYLKQLTQGAEILLNDGQDWPTDEDDREQVIEIEFVTKAYVRGAALIDLGIKRHVQYVYMNRGDCEGDVVGSIFNTGEKSGANTTYGNFRILRI